MFPSNGTTVWVNFKDKQYLGKVLQTSPELDMVCVRISDYVDHVSRDHGDYNTFSHSCPEANRYIFSNCQSSVVITCGLSDVCPLSSKNLSDFLSIHTEEDVDDKKETRKTSHSEGCQSIPSISNTNLSRCIDNGDDDEEDFSNSFGINNILRNSHESKRTSTSDSKTWKCRLCHVYLSDEVGIKNHVLYEHKMETHMEPDNWIVIDGITGSDYEEVKNEEDNNIRSLNNIHLSNSATRKRQFNESMCHTDEYYQGLHDAKDSLHSGSIDVSMRSDMGNSLGERQLTDINFPILNHIIQETHSLVTEIDRLTTTSPYPDSNTNLSDMTTLQADCLDLNNHNNMFHYFLTNTRFPNPIPFSLTNSLPNSTWHKTFRPHSLSDNYSVESLINVAGSLDQKPMFLSPKRSRMEANVKKCRKMYGIDQRHLWCNQCKWKKACSRFCSDVDASL